MSLTLLRMTNEREARLDGDNDYHIVKDEYTGKPLLENNWTRFNVLTEENVGNIWDAISSLHNKGVYLSGCDVDQGKQNINLKLGSEVSRHGPRGMPQIVLHEKICTVNELADLKDAASQHYHEITDNDVTNLRQHRYYVNAKLVNVLTSTKEDAIYKACPMELYEERKCKTKVELDKELGQWKCRDNHYSDSYDSRVKLDLEFTDANNPEKSITATLFEPSAAELLGIPPESGSRLEEWTKEAYTEKITQNVGRRFVIRLKASFFPPERNQSLYFTVDRLFYL